MIKYRKISGVYIFVVNTTLGMGTVSIFGYSNIGHATASVPSSNVNDGNFSRWYKFR